MGVEGAIVQRRQAKAIARIESARGIVAPGDDVAGHQQAWIGQPGDAAARGVHREHRAAELFLPDALFHQGIAREPGVVGGRLRDLHGSRLLQP